MDLGTGVSLATLTITTGVVLIKYVPKSNGNGKCTLHQGIVDRLQAGDRNFKELCDDQKTTKRLVMAIAAKMNISVKDIKSELQDVIGGDR